MATKRKFKFEDERAYVKLLCESCEYVNKLYVWQRRRFDMAGKQMGSPIVIYDGLKCPTCGSKRLRRAKWNASIGRQLKLF